MTPDLRADGAGSGLVVAAQILEWKGRIWEFWCETARALEAQGQQLLLLSPWAPPDDAEWPLVLPMPYAIGEYAPNADAAMARDPNWDHLLATDVLYGTFLPVSRKASLAELASLQAYVRAVFEELAPDVVMGWAPPFPPSRLLLGEAWRREIPSLGLEIGFVPDTLMVESRDVGFGADVISHPTVASLLAAHRVDDARVARMVAAYGTRDDEQRAPWTAADRPVVVLLGSCPGFNLQPRESRWISLGSPWFDTFEAAAEAMRAALPPGATLVLRPHPADVEGQRYSHAPGAAGVPMTVGSVRALVEQADVVAVLGSTRTQLEVALIGTPMVLLSRSLLWGQGAACEYDGANLAAALRHAIDGEGAEARRTAALRVLDFLATHAMFGLPHTPALRGPGAFAAFLGRFHAPTRPTGQSPDQRAVRIARFTARVAPLLAPYVCREIGSGVRPMREAYVPFVEAQLADTVVRSGIATVLVCGVDATARRVADALDARGVRVLGLVGVDAEPGESGAPPVVTYDAVATSGAQAIVLGSHADEASMRARLHTLPLTRAIQLFGPSSVVAGDQGAPGDYAAAERLWLQRAEQRFDRHDWEACLALIERARQARPSWSAPVYRAALVARTRGESAERVWDLCSRALALEDVSTDLVIDAGYAAFNAGEIGTADALARRGARERPESSVAWHLRGLCARAQGAPPEDVARLLDRALEGQPVTGYLLGDAAAAAEAVGLLARAAVLAQAATDARPDWSLPWLVRARCAAGLGASASAVADLYERALGADPHPDDEVITAGYFAFSAGRVAQADALAAEAARVAPDSSLPWHLLALCARQRGDTAAHVLALLDRALARAPVTAEMVFDAGVAAMEHGDVARARASMVRAAAMKPGWDAPADVLAHLATLVGEGA